MKKFLLTINFLLFFSTIILGINTVNLNKENKMLLIKKNKIIYEDTEKTKIKIIQLEIQIDNLIWRLQKYEKL